MRHRTCRRFLCLLVILVPGLVAPSTQIDRTKTPPAPMTKPGPLTILTSPPDGGAVHQLDDPVHVRFSKPVTPASFSYAISPDIGGWSVEWSEDRRRVVLEHANPFAAGAEYRLTVKIAAANEPPVEKSVRFTAYGPPSLELIDEAEKKGTIDIDQAWSYRFQAILEPSALPETLQSVTPNPCGTSVMLGFQEVRPRLKPGTAERLDRYVLRPTDARSVFAGRIRSGQQSGDEDPGPGGRGPVIDQRQRPTRTGTPAGWFGVDSRLYPITVWSAISAVAADAALELIENKAMYGRYKNLMPFEPESDADVAPDNGGDGRLDIYLVPRDPHLRFGNAFAEGLTVALAQTPITPCFIMVREDLTGSVLGSVLAHELFHAFQLAIDWKEPLWWLESTATWSMDFIEPSWNYEHQFVAHAFEKSPHRLKTLTWAGGLHPYGAYLFPYYLSSTYGEKMIGDLWTDCAARGPNVMDAIKSRLDRTNASGFSKAFMEFALMNYDDADPLGPVYPETLDVFPHHGEHKVLLKDDHSGIAFDLPPLSAVYIDVYNHGIDTQKTPSVVFDLAAFSDLPETAVQAVVMRGNETDTQDWTGLKEKLFCLNAPGQDFDRIVVIVSSTETEQDHRALDIPILLGRDPRCDADWEGTLTFVRTHSQSHQDPGERRKTGSYQPRTGAAWVDQFTTHKVEESCRIAVNAKVRMALKAVGKEDGDDELAELNRLFTDATGIVTYTQEALDGTCTINYEHKLVETTTIEPSAHPGEFVQTSIRRASFGSPLIPVGLTLLRAPRLTVDSKKGTYTLEINFTFAQCRGESIVETNKGDRHVSPWDLENLRGLFDSYPLRTQWSQPALGGTFQGDVIRGKWSAPPEQVRGDDAVVCDLAGLSGVKVTWELHRIKR
jgi:hypothetical protein